MEYAIQASSTLFVLDVPSTDSIPDRCKKAGWSAGGVFGTINHPDHRALTVGRRLHKGDAQRRSGHWVEKALLNDTSSLMTAGASCRREERKPNSWKVFAEIRGTTKRESDEQDCPKSCLRHRQPRQNKLCSNTKKHSARHINSASTCHRQWFRFETRIRFQFLPQIKIC